MTRAEVEEYFAQIPVWMKEDIAREIQLARMTRDPEMRNELAALSLAGGGDLLAAWASFRTPRGSAWSTSASFDQPKFLTAFSAIRQKASFAAGVADELRLRA